MVLRTIGSRASEPAVQDTESMDPADVELLPAVQGSALTFSADLKAEETLASTSNAVVVRFDNAGSPALVNELDQTLFGNRAHEVGIHLPMMALVMAEALRD